MENILLIILLLAVVALAVARSIKHFRGGGCCGSGGKTIRSRKKLTAPKIGEKTLVIDGMHCENCQARVENGLNRLDGVSAIVHLHKKTATVSYSQEVSDALLKETVEKLGYSVREIR